MKFNMLSGEYLEKLVQSFCKERNKNEGDVWKRINSMYLKQHDRDIMFEKNKYEKENNSEDIPMSQWISKQQLVHNVIPILDEITNVMV